MMTSEDLAKRIEEGIKDIITVGDLVEKIEDNVRVTLWEYQYICRDEWDEVKIFSGTIKQLKQSAIISGNHIYSRVAHVIQHYYVSVTGTVQVSM